MARHTIKPSSVLINLARHIQHTQELLDSARKGQLVVTGQEPKLIEQLAIDTERLMKFISNNHYKL